MKYSNYIIHICSAAIMFDAPALKANETYTYDIANSKFRRFSNINFPQCIVIALALPPDCKCT